MKILILNDRIPPENRGGAGEVVWRLALGLKEMGHEVHLICATRNTYFEELREGIQTYHIKSDYPDRWHAWLSLYNPQTIPTLKRLFAQIQPDIVNGHNIHRDLSYFSLTLAHRMGFPTVFSSHDVMPFAYHKLSFFIKPHQKGVKHPSEYRLPPFFNLRQMRLRYNPFRNLTIRHILSRHVRMRTAVSQALADAHHANGLPSFTVVHNGINPATMQAQPATIEVMRQELGLEGRKVILFAGRLTSAKGTTQLLDALLLVIKQIPNMTLLVLSPTPIDEQITDPKYQILREKHIVSGGWLSGDKLVATYHLSDVVVVPSIIFDSFPTINLEAMAASKPVIATCFGGSSEAVIDGKTGYIINPFDRLEFFQRLVMLLNDPELCQEIGQAGRERIEAAFSLQAYVTQMVQVYESAILLYRILIRRQ